jgi:hypothetical protein
MSMIRPLLAVLAVTPLAACADMVDGRGATPFTTAAVPASLATEVAPEQALARLPAEAGAVVSVTERREKERLIQTIALAGDAAARGTNRIVVSAAEHDPGHISRMTEERIAGELATELPDVDMRPSATMADGAAGPIGIASGRTARGETCVYAWQEVDARPRGVRSGFFDRGDVDVSVRVRLCRRDLSEAQMVALVEGLRLRSDVATRPSRFAGGPTGVDALATAGYGSATPSARFASVSTASSYAAPAATAPRRVARTERRSSTSATKPAVIPRAVATVAAVPLPSNSATPVVSIAPAPTPVPPVHAVAPVREAPPLAHVPPSVAAPAIPLPSGG